MRDILFRGKTLGGEWIYGDYIRTSIHRDACIFSYGYGKFLNIDPETVGQWTGLEDKNGVKIFEGDIVIGTKDKTPKLIEWRGADFGYSNVMWNKAIEVTGNKY